MGVYIYCIKYDYHYQTAIKDCSYENEWVKLDPSGMMIIKGTNFKGYAWDGCSPKIKYKDWYFGTKEAVLNYDTGFSKTFYASLVHDVFYQFSKDLRPFVKRKEVDSEFYSILKRDDFYFAKLYYGAVRLLGWMFWGKWGGVRMLKFILNKLIFISKVSIIFGIVCTSISIIFRNSYNYAITPKWASWFVLPTSEIYMNICTRLNIDFISDAGCPFLLIPIYCLSQFIVFFLIGVIISLLYLFIRYTSKSIIFRYRNMEK